MNALTATAARMGDPTASMPKMTSKTPHTIDHVEAGRTMPDELCCAIETSSKGSSRSSSLHVRQEDRDLNVADRLTCASFLAIQQLVIVFFHRGHTLFLLSLDVLLRLGCLCLQRLYLGICLAPDSFEFCFGVVQFLLQLCVECVNPGLQLRFAVCLGLGVFGFQLSNVRLNGCDVPFILSVFHFPKAATQNDATQCFHACVHRSGPLLIHLGDYSDLAGCKGLRDVGEKVASNAHVVKVCNRSDEGAARRTHCHADKT